MAEPFHKQLERLIDKYRREVKDGEINLDEVAVWALREGLYDVPMKTKAAQLRRELAAAMRTQTFEDPSGRRVRSHHCIRKERTDPDGRKYVQAVWSHIEVASHQFMENSFAQRRGAIADACFKVESDRQHWNEYRRGENPPIQMELDFTNDVADRMESTDYNPGDLDDNLDSDI